MIWIESPNGTSVMSHKYVGRGTPEQMKEWGYVPGTMDRVKLIYNKDIPFNYFMYRGQAFRYRFINEILDEMGKKDYTFEISLGKKDFHGWLILFLKERSGTVWAISPIMQDKIDMSGEIETKIQVYGAMEL